MTQEMKDRIVDAVKAYMQEQNLSANEMAELAEINPAYLSNMLRGEYTIGEKKTPIGPRWFNKLALRIDFNLDEVYIDLQLTTQFKTGTAALERSKEYGLSGKLIGGTGTGKTFLVDKFCKKNPRHTYKITVSADHTMKLIMEELVEIMGLDGLWRNKNKAVLIGKEMKRLFEKGEKPMIIIDEAENLRPAVLRKLKGVYDQQKGYGCIMLIGTPELDTKLTNMANNKVDGMPQFCRRFEANTTTLPNVNDFDLFFDKYVKDHALQELLKRICGNYGVLVDYMLPVMKAAQEQKRTLNKSFFQLFWNNRF